MIQKVMIILLQVTLSLAAPLQFPLLQPLQGTLQQQQLALQEQMLALQQFQALQRFNAVPSPLTMNQPQPLLILLPTMQSNNDQNKRLTQLNENLLKSNKPSQSIEDEDSDSITIDAGPQEDDIDTADDKNNPVRAILLVPNARFSIGGIISAIPFLPFEINVPDSISWIYNGISGIISGIGQSWPFRPSNNENESGMNMKTLWKNLKMRKVMPIVVMPLAQPMLPLQL